ncbi:hypothetical protein [Spirillospora sp. NBC_01491]|uniref:hypothetical protein n=1 Tax=Spirillospora sp. NBC_01491 TaxID=2976007 RepID=UPI002E32D6CC|nr:hypothetical protein [Spirillospora sp. NBC_01491]
MAESAADPDPGPGGAPGPAWAGGPPRSAGSARPRRRTWRIIAPLLLLLIVLAVLDGRLERREVLERSGQPASVAYSDRSAHFVGVVRTRSWILGRHRKYELYTGRDIALSYGHHVRLDFTGTDRPVVREAAWGSDGVRVHFTSGHEVFVPARYFLNGR